MPTRFYWTNVTASQSPASSRHSAALPAGNMFTSADGTARENLSLSRTKGGSVGNQSWSTNASTALQSSYVARFTSVPLVAQTIAAQTWTWGGNALETNANANSFFAFSLYIWRPSNNNYLYIYDATTLLGSEWGTAAVDRLGSFSGSAVTVLDGDCLVLEVWQVCTQAMATSYAQTVYWGGNNDPVESSTNASPASFIQSTNNLVGFTIPVKRLSALGVG